MSVTRSIVHMDLDTFFVSCERLQDSRLMGKPILIGGTSGRSVVASCSYEARKFGIHSAMPMKTAVKLCPHAIVLHGDFDTYSKFSHLVTQVIQDSVPLYEKTSIDEFYIDLSGIDRYYGCMKFATALRKRIIKETGLPISFGLSINKTVSKIATGIAKPNHQIEIPIGKEKEFLAPLSVRKIPMVGHTTYQFLCDMGIKLIATLQQMPMEAMHRALGEKGCIIWKKAHGIDNSPVVPYQDCQSISTERTFDIDTTDIKKLKSLLIGMVEKLGYQLRRNQKLTACVVVKIRYSDFKTYTRQKRISYTSLDNAIIPVVLELFEKLYERRLLIRLIGVKFGSLVKGTHQFDLFQDDQKMLSLCKTMDSIRDRFGSRAVLRATAMNVQDSEH